MGGDELNEDGRWEGPLTVSPRIVAASEGDGRAVHPIPDGPAPPPTWSASEWEESFEENRLYERWERRVAKGDPNDFIVAVSASPKRTGVSGTGKTTLALQLAKKHFDISESGFNAEDQATVSAYELEDMYRENDPGSALIFDEAQGIDSSSGVNARRAMASSTIDAIGTVAANRMRQMTLIVVSQNIKWLDKNLLDLVDVWVRITQEPDTPEGPEATAYTLYTDDMDFQNASTRTPAITDLTWDDISHRDPDYRHLEHLKDRATATPDESKEREIPTEVRDEKIQQLADAGIPQTEIADAFDLTPQRVSQITD
jgi:hypothetical protein